MEEPDKRERTFLTMAIYEHAEKLDNEELKDVNGGYIYYPDGYGTCKSVVIDDETGEELAVFSNKPEAIRFCQLRMVSSKYISLEHINSLREANAKKQVD